MPYKGKKEEFESNTPSNSNIRAKILTAILPSGDTPDPKIVILCDYNGTVKYIVDENLESGPLPPEVKFKYLTDAAGSGGGKEGAADDPCVEFDIGGVMQRVCW